MAEQKSECSVIKGVKDIDEFLLFTVAEQNDCKIDIKCKTFLNDLLSEVCITVKCRGCGYNKKMDFIKDTRYLDTHCDVCYNLFNMSLIIQKVSIFCAVIDKKTYKKTDILLTSKTIHKLLSLCLNMNINSNMGMIKIYNNKKKYNIKRHITMECKLYAKFTQNSKDVILYINEINSISSN